MIDLQAPPSYLQAEKFAGSPNAISIHLLDGSKCKGYLVELDGPRSRVSYVSVEDRLHHSVNFDQVRYFTLLTPVYHLNREQALELSDSVHFIPNSLKGFRVRFKDNKLARGKALTFQKDDYGMIFYQQYKQDKLRRLYVPLPSISNYQFGEQLGQILVKRNKLSHETLKKALARQSNLLEHREQIEQQVGVVETVQEQRRYATGSNQSVVVPIRPGVEPVAEKPSLRLGDLLEQDGLVSNESKLVALAQKLGLPVVRLKEYQVDSNAVEMLPTDIIHKYRLLPISMTNRQLVLATDDPTNTEAIHMVQFLTEHTPEIVVAVSEDMDWGISVYCSAINENLDGLLDEVVEKPLAVEDVQRLGEERPIIRLTKNIFTEAVNRHASDIHIRPGEHQVELLFRLDGNMVKIRNIPKSFLQGLVSRIKILGKMDISERRIPQDGSVQLVQDGAVIDMRISIMPTVDGESVVIRLLNTKLGIKNLNDLSFAQSDLAILHLALEKMQGLILVTGPTGSGKSTTLYAALGEIKKRNLNIITVEDPVEFHIDNVEQIQINASIGMTFARALRNILRHDPDSIMIGEIRDEETAQIAIQSALTGHLVLSSLHTNSAVGTLTRLKDMNVEPYLVAPTLLCVLSQRLLRCNCPNCTEEEQVDEAVRASLGIDGSEVFYTGVGCDDCNNTGFHGRIAVYELLSISNKLRSAIKSMAPESELYKVAIEEGMVPIVENALWRARQRRIPLSEVFRISSED